METYKKNRQNRVFAPTRAYWERYRQRVEHRAEKWEKDIGEIGLELYAKKYCRQKPYYLPKARR